MGKVDPLELGSIHPSAQLVGVKEAAAAVGQNSMGYRVVAGVLVKSAPAESTQELSRAVDIEEIAADWRLVYRAHLASFLFHGGMLEVTKGDS
jgi:hypothetical protein